MNAEQARQAMLQKLLLKHPPFKNPPTPQAIIDRIDVLSMRIDDKVTTQYYKMDPAPYAHLGDEGPDKRWDDAIVILAEKMGIKEQG